MKRLHNYSQHFLRSPRLVKELIGHTSLKRTDDVLDIGAGSGVITSVLAQRCRSVTAIEFEPQTAALLRKNTSELPNVCVEEGDFLTMSLPKTPYKIFANIPFHLSSAIIHKITEAENPPTDAYLIVQKQFANKLLPEHKGFSSQLGMIIGPEFAIRIRKRLRRTDFWPFPNVDTVLLELKHRQEPLIEVDQLPAYRSFVERCFSSPAAFASAPLAKSGIGPGTKPSELILAEWVHLFLASQKTR